MLQKVFDYNVQTKEKIRINNFIFRKENESGKCHCPKTKHKKIKSQSWVNYYN